MSKNAKKGKKYTTGKIKTAVAKNPGTNDIVYEVVYLEVNDLQESKTKLKQGKKINIFNNDKVLVNSTKYESGNDYYDAEYYKINITLREDGAVHINLEMIY